MAIGVTAHSEPATQGDNLRCDWSFGSLFSGIGGLDLGLERAGWRCSWQVEVDEYRRQVLADHWPDVPRFGDVKELDTRDLSRVVLIAGGFPCPPVSQAGNRLGRADDRWLWPEFARIVRDLRPRFVLMENVTGLLDVHDAFGEVLGDLASLGFDADWSVLSACAMGAPHSRERVFLVAHRPQDDGQGQVSPDPRPRPQGGLESRGGGGASWFDWWVSEPAVDRVAHGLSRSVVRPPLEAIGDAVVPQVAEVIGRHLMAEAA